MQQQFFRFAKIDKFSHVSSGSWFTVASMKVLILGMDQASGMLPEN